MADEVVLDNLVGPVLGGIYAELIEAVKAAAVIDNPPETVVVVDRDGYVRIHAPRVFRLRQQTLQEVLGRRFELSELEPAMPAFAGRLRQGNDEWVWYLERGSKG